MIQFAPAIATLAALTMPAALAAQAVTAAPTPEGEVVARAPAVTLLTWRALGLSHRLSPEDVSVIGSAPSVQLDNVPVVFAGASMPDETDVARAAVLLVPGAAGDRYAAWLARGAAAVLTLSPEGAAWAAEQAKVTAAGNALAKDRPVVVGAIGWDAWARLVTGLGEDPRALLKAAGTPAFAPKTLNATLTGTVTTAITVRQ